MCMTGGKRSFKIRLEVGHRSGMKRGGRKKGNVEERRERISSRKRTKK